MLALDQLVHQSMQLSLEECLQAAHHEVTAEAWMKKPRFKGRMSSDSDVRSSPACTAAIRLSGGNSCVSLWSRCPIGRLAVDRRDSIESGRQKPESTLGVTHRSDFHGINDRREAHGKHMRSDRPCVGSSGYGPRHVTIPDSLHRKAISRSTRQPRDREGPRPRARPRSPLFRRNARPSRHSARRRRPV